MNRLPRLLPLIAIAVGGVVSIKALESAGGLPAALASARAFAQDAATSDAPPLPPPQAAAPAAPTPIAACAPSAADLARDAGLSPAELQLLQSLSQRRGQLDDREEELDTQLQLLAAAEAKLDAKLRALGDLKGEIEILIGQVEETERAEVLRMVTVYSRMKPREAAPIMVQLDDKVRLPVAAAMKEAALAAILAQMPAQEAKKLTESLAQRFDQARAQAGTLASAAAGGPPPPAS